MKEERCRKVKGGRKEGRKEEGKGRKEGGGRKVKGGREGGRKEGRKVR